MTKRVTFKSYFPKKLLDHHFITKVPYYLTNFQSLSVVDN